MTCLCLIYYNTMHIIINIFVLSINNNIFMYYLNILNIFSLSNAKSKCQII